MSFKPFVFFAAAHLGLVSIQAFGEASDCEWQQLLSHPTVETKSRPVSQGVEITVTSKDGKQVTALQKIDWTKALKHGCIPEEEETMRHGMVQGWYKKPVDYDAKSVARGRFLYEKYCLSCHGAGGQGDGPAAKDLKRKPANLADLAKRFPYSHFYMQIRTGRKAVMPAWEDQFTKQDIWHITNYIRSLSKKAGGK